MYLIDTNVVSEARKNAKANPGVLDFFARANVSGEFLYVSSISIGELRRGVDLLRHRGDRDQARKLETWLAIVLDQFFDKILSFDADAAQIWGRLRAPNPDHALDKQIAAIALVNNLVVVTRNTDDFENTGVKFINPFRPPRAQSN